MSAVAARKSAAHMHMERTGEFAEPLRIATLPTPEAEDSLPGVIGDTAAIRAVCRRTRLAAPSNATVLLVGETGTGKEAIARNIHELSTRATGPYIRVNCGALTESLLESELFGHVKGAFTGAIDNKTGRFEAAHTGTLFLDEINSLSPKLQVKLLRVLQEREFERVGETRTIRVDTRVIGATNAHLEDEIAAGRFRADLFYRLNVVPIQLPPLRERKEDIPAVARYFLARFCAAADRPTAEIPATILQTMQQYDWPGNVRELENHVERAVALSRGKALDFEAMVPLPRMVAPRAERDEKMSFDSSVRAVARAALREISASENSLYERVITAVERELITQVMPLCDNVIVKAAACLGINRNTLFRKLSEMKIADALELPESRALPQDDLPLRELPRVTKDKP